MDYVDSVLGKLLDKGYGSLAFCVVVLIMLFLFQRQVDNEQSRILADYGQQIENVGESVENVAKSIEAVSASVAKTNKVAESAADKLQRIDEFGTASELRKAK